MQGRAVTWARAAIVSAGTTRCVAAPANPGMRSASPTRLIAVPAVPAHRRRYRRRPLADRAAIRTTDRVVTSAPVRTASVGAMHCVATTCGMPTVSPRRRRTAPTAACVRPRRRRPRLRAATAARRTADPVATTAPAAPVCATWIASAAPASGIRRAAMKPPRSAIWSVRVCRRAIAVPRTTGSAATMRPAKPVSATSIPPAVRRGRAGTPTASARRATSVW